LKLGNSGREGNNRELVDRKGARTQSPLEEETTMEMGELGSENKFATNRRGNCGLFGSRK